jgi:hypothetical protein
LASASYLLFWAGTDRETIIFAQNADRLKKTFEAKTGKKLAKNG